MHPLKVDYYSSCILEVRFESKVISITKLSTGYPVVFESYEFLFNNHHVYIETEGLLLKGPSGFKIHIFLNSLYFGIQTCFGVRNKVLHLFCDTKVWIQKAVYGMSSVCN